MAIIRNTYTDALFNGLMAAGCTIYGACGAMGNIYAESGANPRNLENLCEKRLNYKYTDDTYTTAVDSGEITRDLFLHPLGDSRQYGYGFCQWTSAGRKAGLYDLVKSKGVSIGDPDTQVEFMLKELQQSYKSVLQVLKTATSVREASDIFLVKFEVPANTGSEVKKTRASYGEQYLKIYKDIEKEETNVSLISNSGHDESGKYSGGKAGDQTGTEWALIPWYNRPWKCVLRHPDAKVRAKLAELGIKAAKNDLVGYDQGQRGTYWEHLKASNYDPSQITIACEGDCSAGVIANIKAAGYLLGIDALKNINATYTGNLRSGAEEAGFQVLTESKYLTGPDYLLAGDILLNDSHHTATNVQDGSKSGGAGTSGSGSTNSGSGTISGGNSKTANIKNGQQWLNSNYGNKLIQFCGAKLKVDGSYGPASRWGALAIWKDLMNRKYGTKLTPTNKNFYGSCKEVAGKAGVHSGTVGTFTFIAQFILSAKGYYTGAMDASCGSKLVEAITAFQKEQLSIIWEPDVGINRSSGSGKQRLWESWKITRKLRRSRNE